MARGDDHQRAEDEAQPRSRQAPLHSDLVEQRAGDEQGDREAEESGAERGGDQLTRLERRDRVDPFGLEPAGDRAADRKARRSEEHTSELQSLKSISYAVFCLKKKK